MPKYKVLCDCYGFRKQYWEKDQVVVLNDLPAGVTPPRHFKLLDEPKITGQADRQSLAPVSPPQKRGRK